MSTYAMMLMFFMSMYNTFCSFVKQYSFESVNIYIRKNILKGTVTHFAYVASREMHDHGSKQLHYVEVFDLENKSIAQLIWHMMFKHITFNDDAIKSIMTSFIIQVEYCILIVRDAKGERRIILKPLDSSPNMCSDVTYLLENHVYANFVEKDSTKTYTEDVSSEFKEIMTSCKISSCSIPTYMFVLMLKHLFKKRFVQQSVMTSEVHVMNSSSLDEHIYKGEKHLVL